jgi:antitoxin CptB
MDQPDALEHLRKRALWRATRRGFKEADIVIGGFAAEQVPLMDADQLAAFEHLLNVPDQDLYAWIMSQAEPAPEHDGPALAALQRYVKQRS